MGGDLGRDWGWGNGPCIRSLNIWRSRPSVKRCAGKVRSD